MSQVRAAAHVHSEWSYDAKWTLAEIADAFARRNYDVVLMAEHDRGFDEARWTEYRKACAAASTERILLVPGIEYEDEEGVVHIPVWGGPDVPFLGERRATLALLRDAAAADTFAVFAHPGRRDALSRFRPEWAPLLGAVEVWNRQYDGIAPLPGATRFAAGHELRGFVSLDFHTSRQFFPLAQVLDVEEPLSVRTIVEALQAGRFESHLHRAPADRFTYGAPGVALRGMEHARRGLRGPVRGVRRRMERWA
jgi:predicted metal-dependent phosphoesterase TrpH